MIAEMRWSNTASNGLIRLWKKQPYWKGQGYYNAAVNRLYYACYYATEALLLKNKIEAKSHAGVKAMLGLHFVSKGLIPVNIGKILSTLYEKRQSGDYDDFIYCDKEMTDDLTIQAKTYIDSLSQLIRGE